MLDGKKKVIFIAGLIFSLVLLILFVFSSSQNISFFTGKYIDENIPSAGNENEIVKNVFLDEYIPKSQGQEEIFFDKKFYDNGRYIINSLNEYSAEWYPDNSPKRDLKKLTIELQITDKETGKSFSIKGTADIPKYYSGHFNFDTSQENFVVFSDLRPDFVWEYSEDFSIVEVKKGEEIIETENKLKTETFVKEKKFDNYKKLDSENKGKIPKELFLDPDISTCGTLDQTGQIYTLTQNVSSSGTCFTITNPNIVLDCQNYWITYSTGSGTPYYGVYSNGVNTTIKNCNIYSANRTRGYWYSAGIQLQGAHNSTLINNYANTVSSQGIMLSGTNYSNLILNRGVTSYSQGIRLDISSYNYLVNNTGVSLVNEATGFTWGARHNLAINHTAIGNNERGIYFSYDSNYNTLINPNSTGKYAFQFSNSSHNTIIDCVNAQGTSYDVYHNDNSIISINNTFLNCSYDSEYLHSSNSINRKWHYRAYVNYTNGNAASGVNVNAMNTTGHTQFSAQTNSSGLIPVQSVTEYVNIGGNRTFYNNYNITASKTGFVQDTHIFNFTITQNKVDDFFTLDLSDSGNPVITFEEPPTPINRSRTSNPVTIVANISDSSNTSSWIDLDRTLVGYWAMDYYNSTGIYDNSSWNNFGTFAYGTGINGISAGIRGNSLEFYGNDSRLNMNKLGSSTRETFNTSGQLTFSAWINPDVISWQGIMGTNTVRFHIVDPGRIRSGIYNATAQYQFDSPNILSAGQWQHVALTYNRSNGNASSYYNGVLVGSRIILNANLTGNNDYFNVGQNWGDFFDGLIDEVMVFNRTLSQSEIKALHSSQINKFNTSTMNLENGQHNYTVYAIDEYGNTANSGSRNFVIEEGEIIPPVITFEEPPTPSNSSTTNSEYVEIVANISDVSDTSSWIDLDRTLVGYWAMDYANSTHVFDNSSYKNNATFNGGLSISNITTGARGNGMEFVGDGGGLGIKYSSQYNITEGITLAIWMKRTTTYTQTRDMHLLSRYPAWHFYDAYNSGRIRGEIFIDGVSRGGLYTRVIPNDDNWYHIVYTYNSATGYARIYTNGVQDSSENLTGLSNYLIDENTTADIRDMGWHNLGRGAILDEAMIFSRSLSQAEIKALYNSKVNKFNTTNLSYSDGKHNYTVYAIDEYGNTANSGERNFIISSGIDCGIISSPGIYTLTKNVSSIGTCFTVEVANVTIDCNGYWINYTGNDIGYYFGIQTNQFNTTVRNCNIYNYTAGIFFDRADNGTIENNNITIYNNKTLPTTIIDYGLTPRASGILIHDSANYNTIVNNTAYSHYGRGIYINTASNNIIKNSNGSSYFNPGIQVYGGLGHEGSHNSIINSFGLSEESNGIRLGYYGYYDSIINSTAISNLDYAILADYGEFIDVINSFANSSSNTGIHFLGVQNGKIINSTGVSGYSQGIIIDYESNNNLISNSTGIGHHTGIQIGWNTFSPSSNNMLIDSKGIGEIAGIYLGGNNNTAIRNSATGDNEAYHLANLNNSRIMDCVYTNGGLRDIYYSDGLSRNNTLLNCSYDNEFFTGSSGEIIRKWYYQAYTNYSNGSAVAGANITAYNTTGNIQFTKQTNSSGYIPRQEITEYVNRGGIRSYYNNYTINASKSGYITDNNLFNFTMTRNKVDDFFTLFLSTCNYSSGNWLINCSENCYIDSNYNIGKNNISIIGVGTVTLSGNISNYNKLLIAGQDSSNICTVRCINGGCFKF